MNDATNLHVLRVFTDPNGNFGDVASVIVDEGKQVPDTRRQELANKLNTGETIFINYVAGANISVMHPQGEIDFAGVGVLATAYLLSKLRDRLTTSLQGRAGTIKAWQDGDVTWVRADLAAMPPWHHRQFDSPEAVEKLTVDEMKSVEHTMVWAWIDESKGLIRARTFANDWEIPEAQGNGSGAMVLAARLQRSIEIKHGEGSVIFAKPAENNKVDVGGRVVTASHDIDEPAKIIWNYLHLNQTIKKCDIIFALGSSDLRVAKRAAQLFLDGYGDSLVISGGLGRISKDIFHKPEAEMFADIAVKMGVPKERIFTETDASNTGQNITFTYDLLQEKDIKPRSILIVTKPYMERRVYATFKKQWPTSDTTEMLVTSPDVSYEEYFTPQLTEDLVLNTMVGDLQRIRNYPARGFQIPQDIPEEVWDAYEAMVAAGYHKSLENN